MGTDTKLDFIERSVTRGTFDHFHRHAGPLWRDAEDKRGLPDPMQLSPWVNSSAFRFEPLAEILTPDLARSLADLAERGTLRPGLMVVNAFMPASEFDRARSDALREADIERPARKARASLRDPWLDFLFLYLSELDDQDSAALAKRFLYTKPDREFGRDRSEYQRLTQKVRDGIDRTKGLLREHGCQI